MLKYRQKTIEVSTIGSLWPAPSPGSFLRMPLMPVPAEPKDGAIASKSILPFPCSSEDVVMKARNAVMDGVSANHRISFFEGNAQTIWWYSTRQCTIDITLVTAESL